MPLGFGATGGENILQQMCHFQGYSRDLEACLWGRAVQFQTYISEMLQRYLKGRNECLCELVLKDLTWGYLKVKFRSKIQILGLTF